MSNEPLQYPANLYHELYMNQKAKTEKLEAELKLVKHKYQLACEINRIHKRQLLERRNAEFLSQVI